MILKNFWGAEDQIFDQKLAGGPVSELILPVFLFSALLGENFVFFHGLQRFLNKHFAFQPFAALKRTNFSYPIVASAFWVEFNALHSFQGLLKQTSTFC